MRYILALMLVASSPTSQGQYEGVRKISMIADVVQRDGTKTRAFLHSIDDSAVYLMDVRATIYSDIGQAPLHRIDAETINSITINRKGQIGRGVAIGALTGLVAGAAIGLASYNSSSDDFFDFGPGLSALGGAIAGLPFGALTGTIVAIPKKFKIHGDIGKLKRMQGAFYKKIKKNKK